MTTMTFNNPLMAINMSNILNGNAPLPAKEQGSSSSSDSSSESYTNPYDNAEFSQTSEVHSVPNSDVLITDSHKSSDKPNFTKKPSLTGNRVTGLDPIYKRGWFRPVAIGSGISVLVLGGVIYAFTGNETNQYIEAGTANSAQVDPELDGRNNLNTTQAQFLSEQERLKAQAQAQDGVTNAAIITSAEANAPRNTFVDENTSAMNVITNGQQGAPRTTADLSKDTRLVKNIDSEGNITFTDSITGDIFVPSDAATQKQAALYKNAPATSQATYNTSQPSGQGGYNQGGNQNYNNYGGGGDGSGGGAYSNTYQDQGGQQQQQQQQVAQPDMYLQNTRETLRNEYDAYAQQQTENQSNIQQRNEMLQQQQQQLYQQRQGLVQSSFSSAVDGQGAGAQKASGFSSVNYNKPANQGGNNNFGGGNNPNGANPNQSAGGNGGADFGTNGNFGGGNNYQGGNGSYGVAGTEYYPQNTPMLLPSNVGGVPYQNYNQQGQGQNGLDANGKLPSHVLRAGTSIPVIITKSVNSDEGNRVTGEVLSGKFAGSTVYGVISPTARSVGVLFTRLAPPNPRKPIMPINAMATTLGSQKDAIATDVKRHYGRNYGVLALTSILEGYGDAYEGAGQTSVVTDSGSIVTVKSNKVDTAQIRGEVIGNLGSRLTEDVAKAGSRPPTFLIAQGTVVNMILTNNLDTTAVATDIAAGQAGQR